METERRKRPASGCENVRRARPREEEEEGTHASAEEDEVEEFFAILRRMHAAGKGFKHANGSGLEVTDRGVSWRPAFEWEDFAGLGAVKSKEESVAAGWREGDRKRREENTEQNGGFPSFHGGLDLNADPEPEHTGAL